MLMLAVLRPLLFGSPSWPCLKVFGYPPPGNLIRISCQRLGISSCPDVKRVHALQRLLSALESDVNCSVIADGLNKAWWGFAVGARRVASQLEVVGTWISEMPLWSVIRKVLDLPVAEEKGVQSRE